MSSDQRFVLSFLVFFLINNSVSTSLSQDLCSKEYSSPREWYEPGCMKCNCVKNGFECYSCGSTHIFTRPDCYLQDKNPNSNYPSCCIKETICKGDSRFNGKLYQVYKTPGLQIF